MLLYTVPFEYIDLRVFLHYERIIAISLSTTDAHAQKHRNLAVVTPKRFSLAPAPFFRTLAPFFRTLAMETKAKAVLKGFGVMAT